MIRKANYDDLESIAKIYEDIITYEEENKRFTAFQRNIYPTRHTAEKALNEESIFVFEDNGEICASIIINANQPKEYDNVKWKYPASPDNALVIHLLCVSPNKSGLGIGRKMVEFAINVGVARNCSTIRLDTGEQNLPARRLYEKIGFTIAGTSIMKIGGLIQHNNHLFYEMKLSK